MVANSHLTSKWPQELCGPNNRSVKSQVICTHSDETDEIKRISHLMNFSCNSGIK